MRVWLYRLATCQPLFFERAFYIDGVGEVSSRIFYRRVCEPESLIASAQQSPIFMAIGNMGDRLDARSKAVPLDAKTVAGLER